MKTRFFSFHPHAALALALIGLGGYSAWANDTGAKAQTSKPGDAASSEPGLTVPVAPQSVFNTPRTPQEGKDPFFPGSTRIFASLTKTVVPPEKAVPQGELFLKGVSGPASHRLAIINNYTFAEGESGEVRTNSGRVHVHCLEIREESVVIQVAGKRRELHLRNGTWLSQAGLTQAN
jgi:hypothetical protein